MKTSSAIVMFLKLLDPSRIISSRYK